MLNTRTSINQIKSLSQENAVLFKAVMEISSDALFIVNNSDNIIVDCNNGAVKLFEAQSKADLINLESNKLLNFETFEFSSEKLNKELKHNGEYSQETSFATLKKNIFWGKLTQKILSFTELEFSVLKIEKSANYLKDEEWLSEVLSITSRSTGRQFFKETARLLCRTFDADYSFIARRVAGDEEKVKIFYMHGDSIKTKSINRTNSFIENTLRGYASFYPQGLGELFPDDELVVESGATSFIGSPFFDSSQEAMGLIGVLSKDVMTEIPNSRYLLNILASRTSAEIHRLRSKEILRQQTKNLAEINHMKDKLLSVISNDLQAPLKTLLGYSGMLRNNIGNYKQEELEGKVGIMDNSLKNLYLILENLSDLARLQQGIVKVDENKNNLNSIFDDVKPHIKHLSDIRQVGLINKMSSALHIKADNYLLRSIFKNLTTYIVKNTLKGGVITFDTQVNRGRWSVSISTSSHSADLDEINFVMNTSPEEFLMSPKEQTSSCLGIFIAKEFMKLQKGRIKAIADKEKLEFRFDFKKA